LNGGFSFFCIVVNIWSIHNTTLFFLNKVHTQLFPKEERHKGAQDANSIKSRARTLINYEAQTLFKLGMSVPDTCLCQCPTTTRHLWLYWIMSFFQIIIGITVSVSVSYPVSILVSLLHSLQDPNYFTLIKPIVIFASATL
jgi:hypothetical protein